MKKKKQPNPFAKPAPGDKKDKKANPFKKKTKKK